MPHRNRQNRHQEPAPQQMSAAGVASQPPSLMEMIGAMNALQHQNGTPPAPPTQDRSDSLTKSIITGVSATIGIIIIGLLGWVATSVATLNTSMGVVSVSLVGIQKSIADLQTSQGSAAQQLADGKAIDAKQDARLEAHEADTNRIKERIRMLEGQPPLTGRSQSDQ